MKTMRRNAMPPRFSRGDNSPDYRRVIHGKKRTTSYSTVPPDRRAAIGGVWRHGTIFHVGCESYYKGGTNEMY